MAERLFAAESVSEVAAEATANPVGVRAPMTVNVVGKSNGVGLARDIDLLCAALRRAGHIVHLAPIDRRQSRRRRSLPMQLLIRARLGLRRVRAPSEQADANIMLEHVWAQYLPEARLNIAVPNPEWFDRHDLRFLHHVDRVWAKTAYTKTVFDALHVGTSYVGFDSEDRLDGEVRKSRTYFHLAGKSTMKGTDRLLALWTRRPDWPKLVVVQNKQMQHGAPQARNIDFRLGYLGDPELKALQNASLFHICTSRTEGWGHYIVEAMSTGAVTITVDAAPMNELVTPERGVLVACKVAGRQRLATTFEFEEAALEAAIERTLSLSDADCERLGGNARSWFLQNKASFPARLDAALRSAVSVRRQNPSGSVRSG